MEDKEIRRLLIPKEEGIYELPQGSIKGMNLPCRIIMSEKLIKEIDEEAIIQLAKASTLPGLAHSPIGLPDMHWGYGVPIGSVIGFKKDGGFISSGMVGFDINCGISLFKTWLRKEAVIKHREKLGRFLLKRIPTGVGSKSNIELSEAEFERVMTQGGRWAVNHEFAREEELIHMEDNGCLEGADPSKVSPEAKKRGIKQLGTLGSGNHFVEISYVKKIFDEEEAKKHGLEEGMVCVMIHTGSRGLGHQIATDYTKIHLKAMKKYGLTSPDKQIAIVPSDSDEAEDYLKAMKCAANFSFANKLILASAIEKSLREFFIGEHEEKKLIGIYTISHNVLKRENINGEEILVHRKGATRAFPGQPTIVAGSMGSSSFLMVGTEKALKYSLGSTCHGAGRTLSRKEAKERLSISQINENLKEKGISVFSHSQKGILEEAPTAYKRIHEVVEAVEKAGISKKVAEFFPIVVIKG